MKMRKIMAICMLSVMLAGLSACGSQEAGESGTTQTEDKEADTTDTDETETEEQDQQENGPVTIKVFCSNDDATQMIEESVEIAELSPENILKALVEKEVLPENVGIISLKESDKDGEKVLDVDFTRELSDYINSMGSTGEYMIMGARSVIHSWMLMDVT